MTSRGIAQLVLLTGYVSIVGANQAVESISTLTPHEQNPSVAGQTGEPSDVVAPVIHDAGQLAHDDAIAKLGEENATSESREKTNGLPTIGYVPEKARHDGKFNLVAQRANETDVLFQKASLSESKKLNESALKSVQQVLLVEPEHPRALLARGRLLVKTQRYAVAKASFQEIVSLKTDDWRPWFWLGTAHLMLGELEGAEVAFDEALARDADIAESWLHRALVEQQRENWQVALQLLSIANEIAPGHPLLMLNEAMCREALGFRDEAVSAYRKFLSQSHRSEASKLLRFEVISHLSAGSGPALAAEVEAAGNHEFGPNTDIVINHPHDSQPSATLE